MPAVNKAVLTRDFLQNRQDRLAIAMRIINETLTSDFIPNSGRPATVDMARLAREMGYSSGQSIPEDILTAIKQAYEAEDWSVSIHSDQRDNYIAFF